MPTKPVLARERRAPGRHPHVPARIWGSREDGPAVEMDDGQKCWLVNGMLHREDGPAEEGLDKERTWYQCGRTYRPGGIAHEGIL